MSTQSHRSSLALLIPTLALVLGACGSNSSGAGSFEVSNTMGSVSGLVPMVVRGGLGVYFADESLTGFAPGTSLNGDIDTTDIVARVVDIAGRTDVSTRTAVVSAEILGNDIFLEVLESEDGNIDWSMDGFLDDRVLLHFDRNTETRTYLATLNASQRNLAFVQAAGRLYFSVEVSSQTGDESSLRYIASGAPLVLNPVANSSGDGTLSPILMGEDEGLIFLLLDETQEGRFLNGDLDMSDSSVLALLDAGVASAPIKNTELAVADENEPFDAELVGISDWTVAFLVDEASEGALSLNDQRDFSNPTLVASCVGIDDTDGLDTVLHFIEFASFMSGASMPVNTGLAGFGRVLAFNGAVATLSLESDSSCDLNEDMDTMDVVARWTSTVLPLAPSVTVTEMHAINTAIPGGSMGISALLNRLIGVVSEAGDQDDYDMRADDNDLVAWLDPTLGASASWVFRHQSLSNSNFGTGIFEDTDGDGLGDPGLGASEPYAGTSWMAPEETFGRLGVTFLESVPGSNPQVGSLNTNLLCSFFQKDLDTADALPVWLDFEEAGSVLDFDGLGFATDMANAGVTTAGAVAFFVVSEMYDNIDYNADMNFTDKFLFRNPLNQCGPTIMSPASNIAGPSIYTDGQFGAMFYTDESFDGVDLNGDNDSIDMVVRYFRF